MLLPLEEDFVGGGCIITEEILARLISSEKGLRKSVGKRRFAVILNKVDHEESERSAEKVRGLLEERGIYKCLITSYGESQRI